MPVKCQILGMPESSRGLAGYGRHESLVVRAVVGGMVSKHLKCISRGVSVNTKRILGALVALYFCWTC